MAKSWDEVKALLDDPYVDADTKEHLLAAYLQQEGYVTTYGGSGGNAPAIYEDEMPDEVREYYDRTKFDLGDFRQGSVDDVYDDAQAESDERGYSAGLTDQNVEDGRTEIEDMQLPEAGSSAGVQKSDEIFDAARDALRIFEDFLPVNDKVPADSLGRQGKLKFESDIVKRYDEQMGISFKNFLDDANRLSEAYGTLSDLNSTTETELNSLYREWTGPAANASYQHYSEKISPNVTNLLEYLQTAPEMINTAVSNIFTACKDKANDVIAMYQSMNGTLGSATPDIADKVVTLANGDFDDQDQVLEVASWVDSVTGSDLEQTIRDDDCGLNDENKEYVIRECKKWIRESFNQDLHETLWVSFDQACTDALEAVNSHYEALNGYLTEYENEFAAAAPPAQQPPASQPPAQQPPASQPSPSTPSTPSSPSSSSPSSPSSATPSTPSMPSAPSTPEVPTPPSTPDSEWKDPNTQDVPTSPTTDQEETVTIKDGDHEISVTSPDGQGMVTVTVDDGSGTPKTYTLDFGGPDETTPGSAGQPGGPGQTGMPGTPGHTGGQGEYGPNGSPRVAAPDAPIEPGPDGKCTITDGDLTITAERPEGQPDTVVVTVDDGTGKPTTYNLDYSDEQTGRDDDPGRTAGGGPGRGHGGDSGRQEFHAMPARGELPEELAEANRQVDRAVFTPAGAGTQPAFEEMPASLQGGGGGPQPAFDGAGTQPAFEEMPRSPQPEHHALQPEHHAFATTASAADVPNMSGFGGGGHSAAGEVGSGWFGGQDQSPSPYMHGSHGEAGLPTAPDSGPGEGPGAPAGQDQAHPGMAGGGMPMMGGAPGGGGAGGDGERAGSQWRTTGDLFDEPGDPQQLRSAFGGENR